MRGGHGAPQDCKKGGKTSFRVGTVANISINIKGIAICKACTVRVKPGSKLGVTKVQVQYLSHIGAIYVTMSLHLYQLFHFRTFRMASHEAI